MERFSRKLTWVMALAWATMGCGPAGKVETTKLEKSFQSAAADKKSDMDQVVIAIKSGDFTKAIPVLKKVIKAGGLTDEQKDGVSDAITGMQKVVSQHPKRYSVEVWNSLSDLVDYLEGKEPIVRPPGK